MTRKLVKTCFFFLFSLPLPLSGGIVSYCSVPTLFSFSYLTYTYVPSAQVHAAVLRQPRLPVSFFFSPRTMKSVKANSFPRDLELCLPHMAPPLPTLLPRKNVSRPPSCPYFRAVFLANFEWRREEGPFLPRALPFSPLITRQLTFSPPPVILRITSPPTVECKGAYK